MKRNKWRHLTVDGKEYRWRGWNNIVIQNEEGKRIALISAAKLKNLSYEELRLARISGSPEAAICPGHIVEHIRKIVS